MSARAERRRQERAQRRPARHDDQDYGVQPGWCATLDDLEDAKSASHDLLIASMGARRTGPVEWRWWTGDEARRRLSTLWEGWENPTAYEADVLRRIGAHLREYGGYLIIAMAKGRK